MLSRWFSRSAAVVMLCGALSCSEAPMGAPPDSILILVEVVGTLPQMTALQVRATLNNQSDLEGLSITQNTSRFAVKLPNQPASYGALKIDAFSLDSDQCQLASGQVTETLVDSKTYYELKLNLSQQPQRRCQLLVQPSGTGSITSDPAGIDCGGAGKVCAYDFPFGTKVTLRSAATTTSYPVWGRGCSTTMPTLPTGLVALPGAGSPSCSLTLNKGGIAVPVTFVQRPCSTSGLCLYNPLPTTLGLNRAWGSGAKDVWAVGNSGTILHHDGKLWSASASPTTVNLLDVHGSSASDVWAGGSAGTLLHYDGTAWSVSTLPATTASVNSVFSLGPREAWAGTLGLVYRWDGTAWAAVGTGLPGDTVSALWSASGSDVWAVLNNSLWRWDGTSWKRDMSAAIQGKFLRTIRGFAANNIWAATSSEVFRFDGTTWTAVPLDSGVTPTSLSTIGFSPGPEVFIGAGSGRIYRHAGTPDCAATQKCWTQWTVADFPSSTFTGVYAASATEVQAVSSSAGVLAFFDGQSWSRSEASGGLPGTSTLYSAFGLPPASNPSSSFLAVGAPTAALHFDGSTFASSNPVAPSSVYSIHGLAANDLWAVSTSAGSVLHWDGSRWEVSSTGSSSALYGVYVTSSPRNIYVVGTSGYIARSADGNSWTSLNSGVTASLYTIHGSPSGILLAGGYTNVVLRSTDGLGATWTNINNPMTYPGGPSGAFDAIYGVFYHAYTGRYWAVGSNGATYYWNGAWTRVPLPAALPAFTTFYGVAGVPLSSTVWTVGTSGTVLKYEGAAWTQVPSGVTNTLYGIWAPSTTESWFVGTNSVILRQKL